MANPANVSLFTGDSLAALVVAVIALVVALVGALLGKKQGRVEGVGRGGRHRRFGVPWLCAS